MKEVLQKVEEEIANRNISTEEISQVLSSFPGTKSRRIIGGYASVSIVDRENQRISNRVWIRL